MPACVMVLQTFWPPAATALPHFSAIYNRSASKRNVFAAISSFAITFAGLFGLESGFIL
ncbi:MAG: hypothetical protein IJL24_01930 [Treponema sp.]|nr:hypothetical protein [Treponema sp.]